MNVPSASIASVPPRMSGRISCSCSVSVIIALSVSASSTLPRMTWTKPASSEPPSIISVTSSQSWNSTGPSNSASISAPPGALLGRCGVGLADSRRLEPDDAMNWSSSVNP